MCMHLINFESFTKILLVHMSDQSRKPSWKMFNLTEMKNYVEEQINFVRIPP